MNKIPAAKPYFPEKDIEEMGLKLREIFESGQLINGKYTKDFEGLAARSIGALYALAFNSCTSALQTVLDFIGVDHQEVIIPTNTFLATANAVLFTGGTPILVDTEEGSLLLDFEECKKKVTSKTKAIVLVHIAGYIHRRIDEIREFCNEHNIFFIEDASHAQGASRGGKYAGSFGDAAVFSMYASKVITTGGVGGVLVTNNEKLFAHGKSLRFHGEDFERGIQNRLGNDWLMTEMQAVVGVQQLNRLSEIVLKRMEIARTYDAAFLNLPGVKFFPLSEGDTNGYYKYPLRILSPHNAGNIREALKKDYGIAAGSCYWPPCHLQPVYKKLFGYKEGDFRAAEKVLSETISLPIFADMTEIQVHQVIDAIKKLIG